VPVSERAGRRFCYGTARIRFLSFRWWLPRPR